MRRGDHFSKKKDCLLTFFLQRTILYETALVCFVEDMMMETLKQQINQVKCAEENQGDQAKTAHKVESHVNKSVFSPKKSKPNVLQSSSWMSITGK